MGYYTSFDLGIEQNESNIPLTDKQQKAAVDKVIEYLDEKKENDSFFIALLSRNTDSMKWYDHEGDLKRFSKRFPDYVFRLRGEGERAEDLWFKYFKNGKIQDAYAKITFPPFDPLLLK